MEVLRLKDVAVCNLMKPFLLSNHEKKTSSCVEEYRTRLQHVSCERL